MRRLIWMDNFCTKCGAAVTAEMSFCPKCGAPLHGGTNDAQSGERAEQPVADASQNVGGAVQIADGVQNTAAGAPVRKPYNTDRAAIKAKARERFKANYWLCVGTLFLAFVVTCGVNAIPVVRIFSFLIMLPLFVGRASFCLKSYRGEKTGVDELFKVFSNYGHNLGGMLWMGLFCFLWSLLFVIPGIIKAFSYWFTTYILEDYPSLPARQALRASMKMTHGHKWELFVMLLSFIGWGLLSLITFGLLQVFYVGPYLGISLAGQYEELKNKALADGVITEAQLKGDAPLEAR